MLDAQTLAESDAVADSPKAAEDSVLNGERMSKQLLILPDTKKFSAKQEKEIREAGFVVVYLPDPSAARIIAPEPLPFTANEMLRAALVAIQRQASYGCYQAFINELVALCSTQGGGDD